MRFHDAYARLTPFEVVFPDAEAAGALAQEIQLEADARVSDAAARGAFAFQALHFIQEGRPVLLVETELCRALTAERWVAPEGGEASPVAGPGTQAGTSTPIAAPSAAGYAQLPRNLFWAQTAEGSPPEPVDGLFWTLSPVGQLHLLVAAGLREGRPGLSVLPLPDTPFAEAPAWLEAPVRERGADFATTLPGGELEGLYSLTAAGEVLKLVARLFLYVQRVPGAARPAQRGPEGAVPAPSALAYRRVALPQGGA